VKLNMDSLIALKI